MSNAASTDAKIPLLASASGAAEGAPYTLWRPQMAAYLMRAGIQERDYAEEIVKWKDLCAAALKDEREDEQVAEMLVLGISMEEVEAKEQEKPDMKAARKKINDRLNRVRKAYAILFSALPADLRQLIAEQPQGYAFGIWSFLENKFRNTDQDSIMELWSKLTALTQEPEESFDVYKARIDSVHELLKNAKQDPPAGLYASILIWRLQPRYNTAVLTLKANGAFKDPAKIQWQDIVQFMAQHERTQLHTDRPGAGDGQRAMPAFAAGGKPWAQDSKATPPDISQVDCFYCKKLGHYRSDCPQLKSKDKQKPQKDKRVNKSRGSNRSQNSSGTSSSDNDSDTEGRPRRVTAKDGASSKRRMNAVKVVNRFEALSDDEEDTEVKQKKKEKKTGGRVHLVRALASRSVPLATKTVGKEKKGKRVVFDKTTKKLDDSKGKEKKGLPAGSTARKAVDTLGALLRRAGLIDTGAQLNTTGNKDALINLRRCDPMPIQMADRAIVTAMYKGDMPLRLESAKGIVEVLIRDVYYHSKIEANLLCWDLMRRSGWQLHSAREGTHVIIPDGTRVEACIRGGLTLLIDEGPSQANAMRRGRVVCSTAEDVLLLHQRTGHASWGQLLKMSKAATTVGIGDVSGLSAEELQKAKNAVRSCTACIQGKGRKTSLGHRGLDRGSQAGEVINMDTFHIRLRDKHTDKKYTEYGLLAVDGYNEQRWFTPSLRFSHVQDEVIANLRNSFTSTGRYPRLLITDLGPEFDNHTVDNFCRANGIKHQPAPRGEKEMNGISENGVRTLKDHTRSMLLAAGLPAHTSWMDAAAHHVFVWNRTHVSDNTGVTPYEHVTHREPSILNIGVFGCDVFVHRDRSQRSSTFSPKAEPGIYLGHDYSQNCPIVRMLHTGKTERSRNVIFREGLFTHIQAERERRADQVLAINLSEPAASSDDEDEDEDQEYVVEAVTGKRSQNGQVEYQVKWKDHPQPSWEPAASLQECAALDEWEKSNQPASEDMSAKVKSKPKSAIAKALPAPTMIRRSQVADAAAAASSSAPAQSDSSDNDSNDGSDDEKEPAEANPTVAARDEAAKRL